MQNLKKAIGQILAVITALAAIGIAVYVVYQNWTQITAFFTERCPHLKSKAMREEYADYVD